MVEERVGIIMLVKINKIETANNTAIPKEKLVFFPTHTVPVRSDIPVSEFPDYVLDMTVENQRDTSKLAIEYQVRSIYTQGMYAPLIKCVLQ